MAALNRCIDCRYVIWDRTAAGRLHPSGGGRCVWTKLVSLPAAISPHDRERLLRDMNRPRWLDRKSPISECDTFVRVAPVQGGPREGERSEVRATPNPTDGAQ